MKQAASILFTCSMLILTAFSNPKGKKLRLIFMGDSITEGTAMDAPEKDAPGVYVADILRGLKKIASVEQSNLGFSGHTTVDFLPLTNSSFPRTLEAAENFAKEKDVLLVFSIMLGTNDSAISGPNGSPVSPEDYKKNLQVIINHLLQHFPKAKIVLQYPIWYSPNTHNGARYLQEGLTRLESYYPKLDELVNDFAASHPKQVYGGSKSGLSYFKEKKEELLIAEQGNSGLFYLHPNEKGSRELAKIWVEGIETAMK